MSQKATRKQNATPSEEKEKVDTPVKEMKKKMAANAEKDKQVAEKSDKPAEKSDKNDADKSKSDKPEKNGDKAEAQKDKQADKKTDSKDKPSDKKTDEKDKPQTPANKKTDAKEKAADKQEKVAEKKQDKTEKPAEKKDAAPAEKDDKADKTKEKPPKAVNGLNGATSNGDNGTVSDDSDAELVMDEDELFPELTYDDSGTDADEAAPSRSLTRRSQVKATKTPDTPAPRPASDPHSDDSKESKVLKLADSMTSDRKLRSADSPKPEAKKVDKKAQDSPKKDLEASKKQENEAEKKDGEKADKMEVEVVVEVQSSEGSTPRTRARVSPYTRTRLDRTVTSVMADYTGNNSTMEMDITESSVAEDPSLNDSAYLRGLRAIRGRASYKQLNEITLTNPNAGKPRPAPAVPIRPLGAVVGRKRKPSPSPDASPAGSVERGVEACEGALASKRMRLLERLAAPWRRTLTSRCADIVGINTDLPLTAPVASTSFASFDPESIKAAPAVSPGEPLATPLPTPHITAQDRDGKKCVVM